MGATFYTRIVLSEILNSIRVIPKADCKLWQSLKEYGIAKTTRRGCRAGAFKHRHITTVTGFGRYSFVPEWQIGCEQRNFQSGLKIQTNAITQINQARRSHVYGTVLGNYNNLVHIKCHPRLPSIVNRAKAMKFSVLNTRSVRNKSLPIKDLIIDRDIDILALTETWLSSSDFDSQIQRDICPTGYEIYRVSQKKGNHLIFRDILFVFKHKRF